MDMDSEEDAIPYLERALELNPDLPQAERALERIREKMDQQKVIAKLWWIEWEKSVTYHWNFIIMYS